MARLRYRIRWVEPETLRRKEARARDKKSADKKVTQLQVRRLRDGKPLVDARTYRRFSDGTLHRVAVGARAKETIAERLSFERQASLVIEEREAIEKARQFPTIQGIADKALKLKLERFTEDEVLIKVSISTAKTRKSFSVRVPR